MKRIKWQLIGSFVITVLNFVLFGINCWAHNPILATVSGLAFFICGWLNVNTLYHYRHCKELEQVIQDFSLAKMTLPQRAWDKNKQGQHLN